MAWGDENQMIKYNVTFAFTDMIMKTPKAGDNSLFLAAQQEAAARAAQQSANEEKYKNDIVVTALKDGPNSTTTRYGGPFVAGNYTVAIPPEAKQNIDDVAAGKKATPTVNMVTIPLTMT
jgi:hypothetical protein